MSKMGQYVMELQDLVFEAMAMGLREAAVVAYVKSKMSLVSESDILYEYNRIAAGFFED